MPTLDDMLYVGLLGMVGNNPMFLGLALFAFFAALVFVLPVRGDVKMMVLIPAAVLSATAVGFFVVPIFVIGLAIVAFALLKFMNH